MAKPDRVFFCCKTESPMKSNRKAGSKNDAGSRMSPVKARKLNEKQLIVGLYLQGNSMARVIELAEQQSGHRFGMHTIVKHVREATEEWKANKADMIENHKAIELEKINRLEATYWNAWARSCETQTKKTKIKKKGEGERMALSQVRDDERQTMGDPRFLTGIQWCTEMRCKILGIETPQTALQLNTVNNTQVNNTTVIQRKVVFLKRETTIQPQTIQTP
jgi:hypothetical protein